MKYVFVGEGLGVPGLPHEVTDQEAEQRGLTELLQAAIQNGNYREAAPDVRRTAAPAETVSAETDIEHPAARPARKGKE